MKKTKTFAIDFLLRKTKQNPGIGYVSAKIIVNGVFTEISINEKVQTASWLAKSGKSNWEGY